MKQSSLARTWMVIASRLLWTLGSVALLIFVAEQNNNDLVSAISSLNEQESMYNNIAFGRRENCYNPVQLAPQDCGYEYVMTYRTAPNQYMYLPGSKSNLTVEELDGMVRKHDPRLVRYVEGCTQKKDGETICTQLQPTVKVWINVKAETILSRRPFFHSLEGN